MAIPIRTPTVVVLGFINATMTRAPHGVMDYSKMILLSLWKYDSEEFRNFSIYVVTAVHWTPLELSDPY